MKDSAPNEIHVRSLTTHQVAPDGSTVCLYFENADGRQGSLKLPSNCVQQLLMTLPRLLAKALQAHYRDASLRVAFPLGDWRLEAAAGSKDVILTMRTSDGFEVAFALSEPTTVRMMSAMEGLSALIEKRQTSLSS